MMKGTTAILKEAARARRRLERFARTRNESSFASNMQFKIDADLWGLDLGTPKIWGLDKLVTKVYLWEWAGVGALVEVFGRCGVGDSAEAAFRAACKEDEDPDEVARVFDIDLSTPREAGI